MVTTQKRSKAETHNLEKEETEEKIIGYHQTKIIHRNTGGKLTMKIKTCEKNKR